MRNVRFGGGEEDVDGDEDEENSSGSGSGRGRGRENDVRWNSKAQLDRAGNLGQGMAITSVVVELGGCG